MSVVLSGEETNVTPFRPATHSSHSQTRIPHSSLKMTQTPRSLHNEENEKKRVELPIPSRQREGSHAGELEVHEGHEEHEVYEGHDVHEGHAGLEELEELEEPEGLELEELEEHAHELTG